MNDAHLNEEFRVPDRLYGLKKSLIRQVFDRALPESINFGLGEPDLPTPDCVRREAIRVISDEMNGYTLQAGLPALREKIAADYPHLNLTKDDCFVTVGSSEALFAALMTLVQNGEEVLMPDPAFPAYPAIVQMAGGKAVYYRLPKEKGFGFDIEEFKAKLSSKTRVVIILSPSNPTGRSHTREELRQIAGVLKDTGIYVVSDEIYRDLYFSGERPASISEFYEKTLVVGGLSKALSMTGWRLGWLAGAPEVIKPALVLHGYNVTCSNTVAQKCALVAWTPDGEAAKEEAREIYKKRRDLLVGLVKSELNLPIISPEGAFYAMLDVRSLGDEMEVCEKFLQNGVVTIPGAAFGTECIGFLRISYCASEDKIREGVRRMKNALQ